MENDQKKVTVNSKNLENYLGKARYSYLMANKKDEVGIARGLAWTQVGGDTLQIEVNVMPVSYTHLVGKKCSRRIP